VTEQLPQPNAPPMSVTRYQRRTSHGFHLFMSMITLGLWLPVWVGMTLWHHAGPRAKAVTTYGADGAAVTGVAPAPRWAQVGAAVIVGCVVLAVLVSMRHPDARRGVESACSSAVASTGAIVTATLQSAQGDPGKWSVAVRAADGQQWTCHVLWDGSHATVVSATAG
jgi:hypothetical protein